MTTAEFMSYNRSAMERGAWVEPLPARGHMPFVGHRTQLAIGNRYRAAMERFNPRSVDYGFDPEAFRG